MSTENLSTYMNPLPLTPGNYYDEKNTMITIVDTKGTVSPWDDVIIGKGLYRDSEINTTTGKETIIVFDMFLNKEVEIDHTAENIVVEIERIKSINEKLEFELLELTLKSDEFTDEQKKKIYYSPYIRQQYRLSRFDNALELLDGTMNRFSQSAEEYHNTITGGKEPIYPGTEKYDYSFIVEKYEQFIEKIKSQKISEIESLISKEDDEEIIAEYKSLIKEIEEDVEMYINECLSDEQVDTPFKAFYSVTDGWPTLLNPSPFHI